VAQKGQLGDLSFWKQNFRAFIFFHLAFLVWIVLPKRERALEREREREMDCNSEERSSSSLLPGGVDRSSAASLSPENSSSSSLSSLATATRTNIFVSRVVSSPIFPLEAAAQAPPPPPPLRVVSLPPKTSDNSLVFSKQLSLPASWPKMGNDVGILEVARPNVSDDEAAPLPQQKQRSEAQVRSSGPRTKKTQKKKKKTIKGSD
jgi:hypothetical protein